MAVDRTNNAYTLVNTTDTNNFGQPGGRVIRAPLVNRTDFNSAFTQEGTGGSAIKPAKWNTGFEGT